LARDIDEAVSVLEIFREVWPCDSASVEMLQIDAEARLIGAGLSGRRWGGGDVEYPLTAPARVPTMCGRGRCNGIRPADL
jgi:hypothetical protein